MSEVESPSKQKRSWMPVISTLVVFTLFGPPVADFSWLLSLYLLNVPLYPDEVPADVLGLLSQLLSFWPVSYSSIGIPFLCVGTVVALYGLRNGKPTLWVGVCSVAVLFGLYLLINILDPLPDQNLWPVLLPALSGIFAAIVCGAITSKLW